jgi:hypothetical protein
MARIAASFSSILLFLYTVKKVNDFSGLTKLSLAWNNKITVFPARESLESDIPAGDRKIENHFLQCTLSVIVRRNS